MRAAWLAVLLVGVGCRAGPEAAIGSREPNLRLPASLLSSPANAAIANRDLIGSPQIGPTAFSTEAQPDANADGVDLLLPEPPLPEPKRPERERPDLPLPSPSRSASRSPSRSASQGDSAPQDHKPVGPTRPISLSLDAAIQTALARNPDLMVIRSGEPVAHAAIHVAQTYPFNPQVQTQVLPYARDRDGNNGRVSQQHVIVQTFELAGQSRFRSGAAAANWRQVHGTTRQAELMTVAQAERLYFTALYQRELLEINRTLATLNTKLVGVIERRLQAGQANNADVALARLQAQSARRQQRLMEANYQTALINLLNYLGIAEDAEVDLSGRWLGNRWRSLADALCDADHGPLDGQSLGSSTDDPSRLTEMNEGDFNLSISRLVRERPDVVAARSGVAMARENLALAKAMRTPNLQLGPMWQRDDAATEFWGVQAQIDIPIINTGTPLVRQRWAELQQQQVTAARLEQKAVLEARAAMRRYERARRLVEQSRGESPQSVPDALRPFDNQFQAGQITLLQVFAGRTSLAQSRQSYLDLLNELALAAADVTQTTGLPAMLLFLDEPPAQNPREDNLPEALRLPDEPPLPAEPPLPGQPPLPNLRNHGPVL